MQKINLACAWNDVALLTDQRAYTFVCKTMLRIPEHEVDTLQEILLADWYRTPEEPRADGAVACGGVELVVGYRNPKGERGELVAEVPLAGALAEPLAEDAALRLLYAGGEAAGEHLLLETALQVARAPFAERGRVVLGQFSLEEVLELPADWPDCQTLLVSAAEPKIDTWTIAGGALRLEGAHELAILYENSARTGEQLFACAERRPFTATVPVGGLSELDGVWPCYREVTAKLVDARHICVMGEGLLYTSAVPERAPSAEDGRFGEEYNRQLSAVLRQLLEELPRRAQTIPAAEPPAAQAQSVSQEASIAQPGRPSVVNSRGSRLATLSRYMRDLNSSVQTPTSTRSFEIGAGNGAKES